MTIAYIAGSGIWAVIVTVVLVVLAITGIALLIARGRRP